MPPSPHRPATRYVLAATWVGFTATALYLYFFRRELIQARLDDAFSYSFGIASLIYLLAGSARAFTLIPSTYLVLAGLPFFPPVPLLVLTLIGILISSAIIYWFSELVHIHELVQQGKHKPQYERLKGVMERHQLPIIIGWSFFPLAPTDLICYVCGILEVNFPKFLLGVALGEGTICAIYIFLGGQALRFLGWP